MTDAATNSTFALVPEVTLPPNATTTLLFTASFDNSILNLAPGTPTRTEVIVSFGNGKPGGQKTAADVDINGNGIVDVDEAWVQSVDARFDAAVPAPTPSNATVTLSDAVSGKCCECILEFFNRIGHEQSLVHCAQFIM